MLLESVKKTMVPLPVNLINLITLILRVLKDHVRLIEYIIVKLTTCNKLTNILVNYRSPVGKTVELIKELEYIIECYKLTL